MKCAHSYRGTFGHECGKPATLAGAKASEHTANGVFWSLRCASCASEPTQDNWGIAQWIPYEPAVHVNVWRAS